MDDCFQSFYGGLVISCSLRKVGLVLGAVLSSLFRLGRQLFQGTYLISSKIYRHHVLTPLSLTLNKQC